MKYLLITMSFLASTFVSFSKEIHDTIPSYTPASTNPGVQILKIPVDFNRAVLPKGGKEALNGQTI